jgi:hypothetical protein
VIDRAVASSANFVDSSGWLEYLADGTDADVFAAAVEDVDHLVVPSLSIQEGRVERVSGVRELGLFSTSEMLDSFEEAGLRAVHGPVGPYGRGLFIARSSEAGPGATAEGAWLS